MTSPEGYSIFEYWREQKIEHPQLFELSQIIYLRSTCNSSQRRTFFQCAQRYLSSHTNTYQVRLARRPNADSIIQMISVSFRSFPLNKRCFRFILIIKVKISQVLSLFIIFDRFFSGWIRKKIFFFWWRKIRKKIIFFLAPGGRSDTNEIFRIPDVLFPCHPYLSNN